MIKNIVFDMGNVLIRFDPEMFLDRYLISEDDRVLLRNEIFRSVEWVMLDRGTVDEEAAKETILNRLPKRLHSIASDLLDTWDEPPFPIPGTFELVERLKQNGYKIYLLSNASVRQHKYWEKIPASRFFDGKLISADIHHIKPEPEIYQEFLDKFGLIPEECVFIDDTPGNVEAALRANIAGIVFHGNIADLTNRLRALSITI